MTDKKKPLPVFFDVKDGVALRRCIHSIDAHDTRFHMSWRSSWRNSSETDNDGRGRSEALDVRFFSIPSKMLLSEGARVFCRQQSNM
jgi:hypothetical protein